MHELIGRVADERTMSTLEALEETRQASFTRLSGLVHASVPPKVEYKLMTLGLALDAAFHGRKGVGSAKSGGVEQACQSFDDKIGACWKTGPGPPQFEALATKPPSRCSPPSHGFSGPLLLGPPTSVHIRIRRCGTVNMVGASASRPE